MSLEAARASFAQLSTEHPEVFGLSGLRLDISYELTPDFLATALPALLNLEGSNPYETARVRITSAGGDYRTALALASRFGHSPLQITTVAEAFCEGPAVLVAAAGDKGSRFAWEGTVFALGGEHRPPEAYRKAAQLTLTEHAGGYNNPHHIRLWEMISYAERTPFTAEQALEWGIIDHILPRLKPLAPVV